MNNENLRVSNYCVCFIDLLGQKNALKGQSIVPSLEEEKEIFLKAVRQSVGAIASFQEDAEFFRKRSENAISIQETLSAEDQKIYDEMKRAVTKQQRWSDGLVFYHSLNTDNFKCPMNSVADIFMLAGTLCMLGLANQKPIRGAIEIGWGVELHNNELYGAVVANSYELESTVAQYPRLVIGEHTIKYLTSHKQEEINIHDKLSLYNRNLADLCLSMTAIDQDGYHILNYLGKPFKASVLQDESKGLYKEAYAYICEQYDIHVAKKDSKLAVRYAWLKGYFYEHKDIHI